MNTNELSQLIYEGCLENLKSKSLGVQGGSTKDSLDLGIFMM